MPRRPPAPDTVLARLAAAQLGLVTRSQAAAAGLSRGWCEARLARGQVAVVRPGVWRVAGAPVTWEQAVLAAVLSQQGSVASHATAARLWGFDRIPATDGIHLLAPGRSRSRGRGIASHRSLHHELADITRRGPIPVTSPARTLADCCGDLGPATGRVLDDLVRRRLTSLDLVRAAGARLLGPGRRPIRPLAEALALRVAGYELADSDLEVRALRAIGASGLPTPVQQHPVRAGTTTYRLDLAYPWWKVAVELLGWTWHGGRSRFDSDAGRTATLVAAGWTLLPFTSTTLDDLLVPSLTEVVTARSA